MTSPSSSMSFLTLWMVVFFVAMTCESCTSKLIANDPYHPRDRHFLDPLTPADSYAKLFDSHTKEERVFSEFEPVMTGHATLWDRDVREAYVKEMARQFRLPAEEEKKLAEVQLQEDETYIVFVLTTATREPEWNDLDRRRASMWRITLEPPDSSTQVELEKIEVVSQKNEVAKYFYKSMSSFSRTYKLSFLKESLKSATEVVLHISGPRGTIAFEFPLQHETKPQ